MCKNNDDKGLFDDFRNIYKGKKTKKGFKVPNLK